MITNLDLICALLLGRYRDPSIMTSVSTLLTPMYRLLDMSTGKELARQGEVLELNKQKCACGKVLENNIQTTYSYSCISCIHDPIFTTDNRMVYLRGTVTTMAILLYTLGSNITITDIELTLRKW